MTKEAEIFMEMTETLNKVKRESDSNYEMYRSTLKQLRAVTEELNVLKRSMGIEELSPFPSRMFPQQ